MDRPAKAYGDQLKQSVPKLMEATDRILYGEIWEDPALSKRDRSLLTIAAMIAMHRPESLGFHLKLGMDNGLTREEIDATITHLAFYATWPSAITAGRKLLEVLQADGVVD